MGNRPSECRSYSYDPDGNLITKLAAGASVPPAPPTTLQITYTYDDLDRLSTRSYSGGTAGDNSPTVTYYYDGFSWTGGLCSTSQAAGEIGLLTQVGSTVSSTSYTHDELGRVLKSTQTTAGQSYPSFSYSCNLAGEMQQEIYPSGRTVNYTYDTAGRISELE